MTVMKEERSQENLKEEGIVLTETDDLEAVSSGSKPVLAIFVTCWGATDAHTELG